MASRKSCWSRCCLRGCWIFLGPACFWWWFWHRNSSLKSTYVILILLFTSPSVSKPKPRPSHVFDHKPWLEPSQAEASPKPCTLALAWKKQSQGQEKPGQSQSLPESWPGQNGHDTWTDLTSNVLRCARFNKSNPPCQYYRSGSGSWFFRSSSIRVSWLFSLITTVHKLLLNFSLHFDELWLLSSEHGASTEPKWSRINLLWLMIIGQSSEAHVERWSWSWIAVAQLR